MDLVLSGRVSFQQVAKKIIALMLSPTISALVLRNFKQSPEQEFIKRKVLWLNI